MGHGCHVRFAPPLTPLPKEQQRELDEHKALLSASRDEQLLQRLTANEGDIAEDEGLIELLVETKRSDAAAIATAEALRSRRQSLTAVGEGFRDVARRLTTMYFFTVDLSNVHSYYAYDGMFFYTIIDD